MADQESGQGLLGSREAFFKNAVVMIYADQVVDQGEQKMLNRLARLLGVDSETGNRWVKEVRGGPPTIRKPESDDAKRLSLDLMVVACKADGEIQERESRMLAHVARQFGFPDEYMRERIDNITFDSAQRVLELRQHEERRQREEQERERRTREAQEKAKRDKERQDRQDLRSRMSYDQETLREAGGDTTVASMVAFLRSFE